MRVLFDARMLDQVHGIGRYVYNLVLWGLEHQPADTQIAVLSLRPDVWSEALERWPRLTVFPCRSRPFGWQEQLEIPRRLQRFRPDLVHFPSLAVPLWCPVPYVVTVHDLIQWHYGSPLHRLYFSTLSRWTTRRARRVVTVSRYSAREISHRLGVPLEQIRVIANGGLDGSSLGQSPTRADVHMHRPYVLWVGSERPHKNLETLLKAWDEFVYPCELVLVTPASDRLRERISTMRSVRLFSALTDTQLRVLYQNAQCVVVPSCYEGFGLPALEALQCGAPLICSDATSLPEVVGEAGLYFDPRSPQQLAARLSELLQSAELRNELKQAGLRRAQQFSWARSAREHWELFAEVFQRARRG